MAQQTCTNGYDNSKLQNAKVRIMKATNELKCYNRPPDSYCLPVVAVAVVVDEINVVLIVVLVGEVFEVPVVLVGAVVIMVVAAVVAVIPLQRYDTALLFHLVLVHSVLKWLHHPLLKYVMLLHPAVF